MKAFFTESIEHACVSEGNDVLECARKARPSAAPIGCRNFSSLLLPFELYSQFTGIIIALHLREKWERGSKDFEWAKLAAAALKKKYV